ncbi:BgTH12-06036 [Blumeria graminis f. sp. triticale]|uniref:BgTH12-06036 n=1 Tax=Blumeria graminis f. sp. triticale TaxID=1689686 RepID=A0A9W4D582_BLUGR|nr:BgTH12-06036 [Blumeria graminis f. sp. triticale]
MMHWRGESSVKGSTESMRMALLTFSLVGLQFTWGIEMTYCTPYLLALGLSKSHTSLVWIAGPISGLIMQPTIGVIADRSTSKYGRRRPFMVVGSLVVVLCLICLGWAKDIASLIFEDPDKKKSMTIFLAVLAIYGVDFAINAVQASCRALIVDTLPMNKQQLGSAWCSRMVSSGHLIGYAIGTLDLVRIFGTSFGDSQFKQLITIAAIALLFTISVTSWAVTEKVLVSSNNTDVPINFVRIITTVYRATASLPPRIQAICNIQLWSWIGWFPFHFYSTTFVGEIYFRYDAPNEVKSSPDALGDIGRRGSLALVIFSLVNLIGALLMPHFVKSLDQESFTHRPPAAIAGILEKFNKNKPDLLTAWTCGHILFTCTMVFAPFAHSFRTATFLVGICGLSWSLSSWAPGSYLGMEVNRLSSQPHHSSPHLQSQSIQLEKSHSLEKGNRESNHSQGEVSGLYFGILNIYTTIPQFIGTFISMIVFAILEPGKSQELSQYSNDSLTQQQNQKQGPNAISVCLLIGAGSMVGAAFATQKLKRLYRSTELD